MNKVHSRPIAWTIWAIAAIFYAYQYILRVMPSIFLDDIMGHFGIGAVAFGQFSGVYYIGYSLVHLPIGIMLDRFGPRRVMSSCMLLTVVGSLPLIYIDQWTYSIIGRILIGIGSSAAILGAFKIIRMAFDEAQFSRMLSFCVTIGLLGAIYGGGPVSFMRDRFGYEFVVQMIAITGIILAIATFFVVPNITSKGQSSILKDVKEVLGNRRVLLTCLSAGLMVGPLEGFADVWGSTFLKMHYQVEGSVAASLPSLIFLGMCFGGPILSLIAEKVSDYLITIIAAGLVMASAFFLLLFSVVSVPMLSVMFILVGISCAYQILAIFKASTYVREDVAGLTTAVANMIIMFFGYAFHTVIGTIVNSFGGIEVSRALVSGIAVIPFALILGGIGFFVLHRKERKEVIYVSK